MDTQITLSADDRALFASDILVAKSGFDAVCRVHESLERIKSKRWWQTLPEQYRTWEQFCREHLGYSRGQVWYILDAQQVKVADPGQEASGSVDLVVPEDVRLLLAHKAVLARVVPDQRQKVLDCAVRLAALVIPKGAVGPRLTVKLVAQAIKETTIVDVEATSEPASEKTESEPPDVPDACIADRETFVQLLRKIDALGAEIKAVRDRTSARFLQVDPILVLLRNVRTQIKWGMPHCWCVYCDNGVVDRNDCEACHGLGFNSFGVWRGAPQEERERAKLWNFETSKKQR